LAADPENRNSRSPGNQRAAGKYDATGPDGSTRGCPAFVGSSVIRSLLTGVDKTQSRLCDKASGTPSPSRNAGAPSVVRR
jgi:hypothetical protein